MTKAKGNMYEFITHTWNPIKGKCLHDCSYCYMKAIRKRFNQKEKEPRLDEKEMKVDLGNHNFIFVGSSCDIFANDIPYDWLRKIAYKIHWQNHGAETNSYLFQTKNPKRYTSFELSGFRWMLPATTVLCTTIESSRDYPEIYRNAPPVIERVKALQGYVAAKMITIEPIMDFDLLQFLVMIDKCSPEQVNIGADSGNNHLPEPEPEKIRELIRHLEPYTKVHLKKNLKRLLPEIN